MAGIDRQLYAKYGLDNNEISFIELHVKEMTRPWHPSNMLRPSKTLRPAAPSCVYLKKELESIVSRDIEQNTRQYKVGRNQIRSGRAQEPAAAETSEERNAVNKRSARKQIEAERQFENSVKDASVAVAQDGAWAAAKSVEMNRRKHTQDDIENEARRRPRGFSRAIPSFLMAYGDGNTTLANFDELIPSTVFKDVAGIMPEESRFLRNGDDYPDNGIGENKRFKGASFQRNRLQQFRENAPGLA